MAPPLSSRWRWLTLAAAFALLDISVTFENIWPTPAVTWRGELSLELAVCLLALAAASRRLAPGRAAVGWITAAWTALVIGRYAEVTAPALYGRDINLYWDLRFIPDVAAMVTRVAPAWLMVVSATIIVFVFVVLYRSLRSAWRRIADAMTEGRERRALVVLSLGTLALFIGQHASGSALSFPSVATPVTATYARQIRFVIAATSGSTSLPASPPMDSDLSRIAGADVFVIFVESYGAISFERPDIAAPIAASRSRFEADIRETHREVVSAYVESPTFGGSSWLAHLSLLSGIEVRDPDTNARLMAERRDTLARAFSRHGYRTVALMPGLRQAWPEGVFYGFEEIYGADRLAYRGPEFGWFAIPDQFSLDRLDALEAGRGSRQPLFVVFPTISTHFPFSPTPPYQPDWRRMATDRPYDGPAIVRAYAGEPDWINFAPGYVEAVGYEYATIGGYLRARTDRDLVLVVLGDHQPPAAVSGEGAPWDVPVHVIASRPPVLDRLRARGFRAGLTPARPAIGRMHELVPVLLDAFGERP
jgi:sulfatase-like protein